MVKPFEQKQIYEILLVIKYDRCQVVELELVKNKRVRYNLSKPRKYKNKILFVLDIIL
jgi:hypothetical protein